MLLALTFMVHVTLDLKLENTVRYQNKTAFRYKASYNEFVKIIIANSLHTFFLPHHYNFLPIKAYNKKFEGCMRK